jgi:hypothetical protein
MKKILFLFVIFCGILFAEPFKLSGLISNSNVTHNMYYIEDVNNAYTAQQIVVSDNLKQLQKSNLGNVSCAVWTKLEITNNTKKNKNIIVNNMRPGMDLIDVYI